MKMVRGLLVAACFAAALSAHAGFDEGMEAYGKGDYTVALREFKAAAEKGDLHAQQNLGMMYAFGLGVDKDEKLAVEWYRKAAEKGFAPAQHSLGQAYEEIIGVWRDETVAAEWYRKAAEQGYGKAQFSLGLMYARGLGVKKDLVQAYKWFHLAALSGEPYADRNRDNAEKQMSKKQIEQAMELAMQWEPPVKKL
ncbi:hypothetical protein SAMN05660284_00429 [Formivibrio citricus]|uniref:Sel1 repeat-containing protein n=1 Tax=Formivibrio citricus TaxID=83765 RepID=A0A1I4VX41_9NEIS|nr:tetratricopeptide repeat protein [Formivibrio citricus]SFN05864.1 hypothetical protein SAMN05660284_00429 [Formivibrio citricus]